MLKLRIKDIRANHINQLISVEGVVAKQCKKHIFIFDYDENQNEFNLQRVKLRVLIKDSSGKIKSEQKLVVTGTLTVFDGNKHDKAFDYVLYADKIEI